MSQQRWEKGKIGNIHNAQVEENCVAGPVSFGYKASN